jgi:hypothetical protein
MNGRRSLECWSFRSDGRAWTRAFTPDEARRIAAILTPVLSTDQGGSLWVILWTSLKSLGKAGSLS